MASWMSSQHAPMTSVPQNPPMIQQNYSTTPEAKESHELNLGTNLETKLHKLPPPRAHPLCPICKGHKYGFTRYFHNVLIFPTPPHHLLPYIEQSYILRNRLQSLFFSYGKHRATSQPQEVERDVHSWTSDVQCLIRAVFEFARMEGFELMEGKARSEGLIEWMRCVVEWFFGGRMGVEKGQVDGLLFEFRKLWEKIWVGYLEDQKSARDGGKVREYQ